MSTEMEQAWERYRAFDCEGISSRALIDSPMGRLAFEYAWRQAIAAAVEAAKDTSGDDAVHKSIGLLDRGAPLLARWTEADR